MNLEQIYVDTEEFSFEELLAKKRGLYGLKFEKQKSPVANVFNGTFETSKEKVLVGKLRSPPKTVLQQKATKPPSPQPSPHAHSGRVASKDDDIVYMPIRG